MSNCCWESYVDNVVVDDDDVDDYDVDDNVDNFVLMMMMMRLMLI